MAAVERGLGWLPARRRRLVWRRDGGFGTETHRNWALWHGYQGLAEGHSGKRAQAFAQVVPWWEELRTGERWMAPAPTARRYYRRPQPAVLKWQTAQGPYTQSRLTTSLTEPSLAARAEAYDDRAAIEAALNAEKGGLQRHRRRQQRLAAQEAFV